MPLKLCPACGKTYGPRQKECTCGHVFSDKKHTQRKTGHPLYPEPGAWVLDETRGMPKLSPPGELPDGLIGTKELRDEHIAYEGLGFCIYTYVPANKIEDPKLRSLWKDARAAMQKIVNYMETI